MHERDRPPEADADRRPQSERSTFSVHRGTRGDGKTYLSVNLTTLQFFAALLISLGAAMGVVWKASTIFLRPEVVSWVRADMRPEMERVRAEHAAFALQSDLQRLKDETVTSRQDIREELRYIRQRVDEIALRR